MKLTVVCNLTLLDGVMQGPAARDFAKLKLVHSVPTTKGVLIATYEPA